ncbi:hypothetical protein K438DRAFT_1839704 [Mycena galopus ATCC 62051]|nr:hypothetical protein K438DRAFT_1839704 [Mycena galopus ATCC 62051]
MDLNHRFPNELWLAVFTHLPLDTLRSLSATRRTFYHMARPCFWASPNIAPHVRRCTVSCDLHQWQGAERAYDEDRPHILMIAFFECLPHFTGLQRLDAIRIQFTQAGIVNLCGLRALTQVKLLRTTVAIGEHIDLGSLTLRVTTFIIKDWNYQIHNLWLSLLSRDTLRELHFPGLLALAKPGVPHFPNVHVLTLHNLPSRVEDTIAILNKFPRVRVFSTNSVLGNLTPSEASLIFPALEEYTGCYKNLHIFIGWTTLTRITVSSDCLFRHFLAEFQGGKALPNITSLAVSFRTSSKNVFGKAEIDTLFALFPGLAALQLTLVPNIEYYHGFTCQAVSFLKILATSTLLPSTLESLSLDWYFYDRTNCPAPKLAEIPDFAFWRDELVGRCSSLTNIFLDGYHFLFWWLKTPSVWEATIRSHDGAQILREQRIKYRRLV